MSSQINVDTIVDKAGSGGVAIKIGNDGTSVYESDGGAVTQSTVQSLCKAWFCFNGDSTPALLDSFNMTSITDEATGKYTFAINNDFNNTNYSAVGMPGTDTGDGAATSLHRATDNNVAVGTIRIECTFCTAASNALVDRALNHVAIFGDLA